MGSPPDIPFRSKLFFDCLSHARLPTTLAFRSVVISPDLRIAALALGAALCVTAILSGVVLRSAVRTAIGAFARAAIVVGGIALMIWALAIYVPSHMPPAGATTIVQAPPVTISARDLVGTAAAALEACPLTTAPPIPNSERASLDEMEAARSAFQAYDAATNAYTQCVDATIARMAKQFAGVASESDLQALNTFGARAHNAAIEQEKASVDQFNIQIRAYRAKHPK